MLAQVWSAAVRGIDGYPVTVELDLANGLPSYTTVGLPDSEVKESRERVVAAVRNSGFELPCRRVTVNLAPAEFRKRGTQFDLPVALGLLVASDQLKRGDWMGSYCFMGELALDGAIKPVSGVLPMVAAARSRGMRGVILSRDNAREAAAVGIPSYGVSSLREAVGLLNGRLEMSPAALPSRVPAPCVEDLADVKGHSLAKRALEIAAAGGHNLLLVGPPGTGKSMLARRLPGILPELGDDEALEVAKIRSVVGLLPAGEWPSARPFRAPHHTVTAPALVGGGSPCRPGEVTLAHRGVLFLDELPEFSSEALEALRVPLETRRSSVSRLCDSVEFPAQFLLVAAMNPCPCGYRGHPARACECTPPAVTRYRSRVSGPLLDRIDLRVEMSPISFKEWHGAEPSREDSATVRGRAVRAREIQSRRIGAGRTNADMTPAQVRRYCRLSAGPRDFLETACVRLFLSARGLDRILKASRTIADLEGADALDRRHVAEAVTLSGRERTS